MFDAEAVRERIAGSRFGRLNYAAETDSTNDDAAQILGDPSVAGSILLAEYQRHGRGRRGRRWIAPPGSALLFTVLLPAPIAATALWVVPFWCALAVADAIESALGVALTLQWPNDLLLGRRKACGILSTSRVTGNVAWAACGVGLNVMRPKAAARSGLEATNPAEVSIDSELGSTDPGAASTDPGAASTDPGAAYLSDAAPSVSREDVFVAMVRAFDDSFDSMGAPREVAERWSVRAGLPDAHYRILVDGEPAPFEARALRLGEGGELVVESGARERSIALGEARVLR